MKSTGIVRKVDELGRVVLPIELRRSLKVQVKDPMEIFVEGDQIIMKKYQADKSCFITGEISEQNVQLPGGQYVSPQGMRVLKDFLVTHDTEE